MPETYGLPEPEAPEPTVIDEAARLGREAVAGRGVTRTVILYTVTALLIVSPFPVLAVVTLMLLLATDTRLE